MVGGDGRVVDCGLCKDPYIIKFPSKCDVNLEGERIHYSMSVRGIGVIAGVRDGEGDEK